MNPIKIVLQIIHCLSLHFINWNTLVKHIVLILNFTCFFAGSTWSQEILTTFSGQKIMVHNEGNWYYDSLYILKHEDTKNQYFQSLMDFNDEQKSYINSILSKAEIKEVNFAIRANQLDINISKVEKEYYWAKKSNKKDISKLLKKDIDKNKKSLRDLLQYYKYASENLKVIYSMPQYSYVEKTEYILQLSQVYDVKIPDSLFFIDESSLVQIQNDSLMVLDKWQNDTIFTERMDMDSTLMYDDNFGSEGDSVHLLGEINNKSTETYGVGNSNHLVLDEQNEFDWLLKNMEDPLKTVYSRPKCKLQQNSKNKKTRFAATYPEFLCGHVPPMAKNYFKDSNLLEVESVIVQNDNKKYLQLIITIMNRDAGKNYGFITKNALIKFVGINGKHLNLLIDRSASTSIEAETGKIVYKVQKELLKGEIWFLKNIPLDTLGIMWTSGFEMYHVYNVDVIMNQLYCIEN